MQQFLLEHPPIAAVTYAAIGLTIFLISILVIDKATPGELWQQILDQKNVAAAIVLGAMILGIAIIVAVSIA